mmetsp:Transcript_20474/g.36771  ORF Transcript_20474/g.36771 Transcript_20474/m.36771 type:complete len:468 (+) Transcript_20474:102-1505(+)
MWVVLSSNSSSWNPVERLIFPAPTPSYTIDSFPRELILIPREDGLKVPCIFLPFRHARFVFIYFHANAEDLGLSYSFCKILRDLFQVHVLAVEYPGYGICQGTADEAGIIANARAAMEFVTKTLHWPSDGVKLFGRSLGTGPTVMLAAEYHVAGVILISPFTGIKDLFEGQVGRLADIVEDRFSNLSLAPRIRSPTLIIHGMQDGLVPPEHGRRIYAAITSRRMLVTPTNMSHNTSLLKDVGTFILPMTHFFSLPDYTFEEIEVPLWAYPPSAFKDIEEEEQASHPPEDETPAAARQLPVIEPGWLAPPTWLCGRASNGQSGGGGGAADGAIEAISRLDPADAKKKVAPAESVLRGKDNVGAVRPLGASAMPASVPPEILGARQPTSDDVANEDPLVEPRSGGSGRDQDDPELLGDEDIWVDDDLKDESGPAMKLMQGYGGAVRNIQSDIEVSREYQFGQKARGRLL